ncbi:HAMP domain-containing protein [Maribellus comscasis]|uniref:histidine kinase n=1 Tax=Maribellus comscasis TaxID=2681766 RepID=A0A6I6JZH0_9BACT|nr:HAMP domain-containing sensor histidine kinase [Maribellus comscasis]QGY46689.1 HAMP domain-containing protein [Maribellus comscasis]
MSTNKNNRETDRPRVFSRLFWQVSAIFLSVLGVFAAIALYISVQAASNYSEEVNQKLNRELASNMLDVITPMVKDSINEEALADIMHSMMVINPTVEVYLLDKEGTILSYVVPEKDVKLEKVSLVPIRNFLNDRKQSVIYGNDPRNPGESKIFSAARITEDDQLLGYLYIVLASQEYISASHLVIGSYILGLSIRSVVVILIVTAFMGLVAFWFLTKKLNVITSGIQKFRSGQYNTRIPVKDKNELDKIGLVFNEMAETIEKNIEELKGVDTLRKELISNVSHDLRTPVASIQGYAETLLLKKDDILKEDRERYLKTIVKSSERLKKLVSELFELSKLESNQIKPEMETFVIAELIYDIANKYRIISQKKGVSINTVLSKDLPLVEADISLLERALQNLIDNAIKFCEEGDTINIEVNTEEVGKVSVQISDSGQGIKQEDIPHIFERYYKGREHTESTGLGLAIVKKIMELHHSDIKVFSQFGKGTTFSFHLPVAQIA